MLQYLRTAKKSLKCIMFPYKWPIFSLCLKEKKLIIKVQIKKTNKKPINIFISRIKQKMFHFVMSGLCILSFLYPVYLLAVNGIQEKAQAC